MRILLTNDDGIDSVGLHVLARRIADIDDVEVVVAAPDREYSGFGAALGTLHLLEPTIERRRISGVDEAWAVEGAPALCVYFARLGVFGDIDFVVSGINPGANTGRAIYHSGTVGAVLTARNGGLSGVAISQSVPGFGVEGQSMDDLLVGQEWDAAAEMAAVVTEALLAAGHHRGGDGGPVVANVNVPNLPLDQLGPWRYAEVGTLVPRSVADARLEPVDERDGTYRVAMSWGDAVALPVETDGGAVEAGEVAVSFLSRIVHEPLDVEGLSSALERRLR